MAIRTKWVGAWLPGCRLFGLVVLVAMGMVGNALHVAGAPPATTSAASPAPAPPTPASDNSHRWVAVICGTEPVTREEFAEYLIARHADQLELLVNKRIIEHACKQRGLEITPTEVDAALAEDLKEMKINLDLFVNKVLKNYHKTLFEWKEDVIRPRLGLSKLCKDRIHLTEQDYKDAFEAYYGEKIECRMILWPKGEEQIAFNAYGDLRKSDENFDRAAKQQASPTLASGGGRIRPIGRHTTGNDELEKEAFSLQPGELSRLIGTPEGTVLLKCVRRIPADKTKTLAAERVNLEKEIIAKKTQVEIPKLFKELRDQAEAKLFLKPYTSQEDLERDVRKELQADAGGSGSTGHKPGGR